MINLIGIERKKQLHAARRNSIWVRYIFLLVSTLAAVSLILGGASFYFYGQKLSQDEANTANKNRLFTQKYKTEKAEVEDFRKKLNTAKAIFDAETYYSAILLDVAKTMPSNTILTTIEFSSSTFQAQQILNFQAKGINDALALKGAFVANPPLSSEVRFSSVTKSDSDTGIDKDYPVKITMYMNLAKPDNATGADTKTQQPGAGQ